MLSVPVVMTRLELNMNVVGGGGDDKARAQYHCCTVGGSGDDMTRDQYHCCRWRW